MAVQLDPRQKVTVSIAALAGLVIASWQAHIWLGGHLEDHLVTTARAAELSEQIAEATDAAKQAAQAAQSTAFSLTGHVKREDLKEARVKLETAKTDLATTQLWEKANQPNEITRARVNELERAIALTQSYITCLDAGRLDCQP